MGECCLSIIVPVYNQEQYLGQCLNALVVQDMDSYEILCIDDGSTDTTPTMLRQYEQQYDKIQILTQPHSGLSAALNLGLDNARGKYVWFVDSDDFIRKNCLSKIYDIAQQFDIETLEISYLTFDDKKGDTPAHEECKLSYQYEPQSKSVHAAWQAWIRRSILVENHIRFDTNMLYGEDTLFQYFVYLASTEKKHIIVNPPLYFYRKHPKSLMGNRSVVNMTRHTQDLIYMAQKYKQVLNSGMIPSAEKQDNTRRRVNLATLGALSLLPDSDLNPHVILRCLKNENLYPLPFMGWHVLDTQGAKQKVVEGIKLLFALEMFYWIYYFIRKNFQRRL